MYAGMEGKLKRRSFIGNLGILGASALFAKRRASSLSTYLNMVLAPDTLGAGSKLRPFEVMLPTHVEPLPYRSNLAPSEAAFSLRGIKGWAWSPEQYLAEIPVMAKYRFNFLMNDYGSLWELKPHGTMATEKNLNFWYRPLSPAKEQAFEKVIRSCQRHAIKFSFSVNPNLRSDQPIRLRQHRRF